MVAERTTFLARREILWVTRPWQRSQETVSCFTASDLGRRRRAVPAGQSFSGASPATSTIQILINGVNVTPSFAGISRAGLFQFNLTIPAGLGTGDVALTASVGGVQTPSGVVISLQSAPTAPQLKTLSLPVFQLTGGQTTQGTITLTAPAPAGGAVISVAASPANLASVPATVTVLAGSVSATFTISTNAVTSNQQVGIGVAYNGLTASVALMLTPAAPATPVVTGVISTSLLSFQLSGGGSCGQTLTISADAGRTTYSAYVTEAAVLLDGVASNQSQNFTFNTLQSGAQYFICAAGSNYYALTLSSMSMSVTLAQTAGGGIATTGNLTGTFSLTGTPIASSGSAVTLSGSISGPYTAVVQ